MTEHQASEPESAPVPPSKFKDAAEEGFLSTSPDSANGDAPKAAKNAVSLSQHHSPEKLPGHQLVRLAFHQCSCPEQCVTLNNILDSFKAPLSEDQAWALIHQFTSLYYKVAAQAHSCRPADYESGLPTSFELHFHRDGSVHFSGKERLPPAADQQGAERTKERNPESAIPRDQLDHSAGSSRSSNGGDSSAIVINRGEFNK